jgi:hypothetical protein
MEAIAHAANRHSDSSLRAVGSPAPATAVESVRTLTVNADYRLSEVGRKASLLNGGNGRAEQHVKIAVPLTRLHLVHVDGNGIARLKLRPQFKMADDHRVIKIKLAPVYDHPPTIDELFQDAARNHELERVYHTQGTTAHAAKREALNEWRNQVALEFLNDPNRRAVVYPPPSKRRCQVMTDRGPVHFDVKRDTGVARQVPLEAFRRFENDIRIRHGQGADQRSRNLARHAERVAMMREWIAVHGTADQRERLAAGVLPFQEFLDALTDLTFQPLSHLTPYRLDGVVRLQEQLRQLSRRADAVVAPNELSVVTRLLPTATARQWALATEIRHAIPGAQVQLRERSLAWTRDAHAPKLRIVSALVTVRVGVLLLRREFHVPDSAPDTPERTQEDALIQA